MNNPNVPRLSTALQGPLKALENTLITQEDKIEQWFRSQWQTTPAPFYSSVDLRNSGYKVAPVDTNLFPAGFNNINPDMEALCVHAIQSVTDRYMPEACKILLIAEDHTRNQFYWKNILRLEHYFKKAGYEIKIGSISKDLTEANELTLDSGETVIRHPLKRINDTIYVDGEKPCMIILNNDMSGGFPEILKDVSQTMAPPPELGWSNRLKSEHFTHYQQVATELAEHIGIDPWLLNPIFTQCGEIDFKSREGEDCLSLKVAETLIAIKKKYDEYGIDEEPFVFVKADAGTYGMNIMVVKSPDEVRDLNRKQRNKMAKGKDGHHVANILVQEGVRTYETWGEDNSTAEPVVYMINNFVVGGFYRVHTNKGNDDNLNAPGAHFEPLPFADDCVRSKSSEEDDCPPNRFYTYGVVARMACLAAAREKEDVIKT